MDDSPAWPRKGGVVEPSVSAGASGSGSEMPGSAQGRRFELCDATTDLMYHAKTFDDMVIKADRAGAIRFTAIDEDGNRSFVHKTDGAWQRPPWLIVANPSIARDAAAIPTRDEARGQAKVVPLAIGRSADGLVAPLDPESGRATAVARLEAALSERYVIKRAMVTLGERPIGQTEYRFRGDTTRIAFTESTFRLATDMNNPSVARSMVDVAETRGWNALRVSGHEEFRRMVWFEASLRDVKSIGYEPMPSDMAWLRNEREMRRVNRIEQSAGAPASAAAGKASARGGGSRKTVLAAIEAVLVAQRVPERQRAAVMAAAADNLAKRLAAGEVHKIKVYDKALAQQHQRSAVRPAPEQQRSQERNAHLR